MDSQHDLTAMIGAASDANHSTAIPEIPVLITASDLELRPFQEGDGRALSAAVEEFRTQWRVRVAVVIDPLGGADASQHRSIRRTPSEKIRRTVIPLTPPDRDFADDAGADAWANRWLTSTA
ncbi:MAG TPA: hypothetical protein VGG62_06150 [Terracidiphilus sp.]